MLDVRGIPIDGRNILPLMWTLLMPVHGDVETYELERVSR
jgi:hypothetical protein